MGLREIFLRPLSPYGFAIKTKSYSAYDAERWLAFYEEGLDYILELNRQGVDVIERYAAIILQEDADQRRPRLRRPHLARRDRDRRARLQLRRRRLRLRRGPDARRDGRQDLPARQPSHRHATRRSCSPTRCSTRSRSRSRSARRCAATAPSSPTAEPTRLPLRDQRRLRWAQADSAFCQRNMAIFKLLLDRYETDPHARETSSWTGRRDDRAARRAQPPSTSPSRSSDAVWLLVDARRSTAAAPRTCAYLVDDAERRARRLRPLPRTGRASARRTDATAIELPAAARLPRGWRRRLGLEPDGARSACLWRPTSHQNSVLLTERCDNYCLMCSQPPKERDDDWLLDDARRADPPAAADDAPSIGFTGGEPTLYGERLDRAAAALPQPAARRRRPRPLERPPLRRLRLRRSLRRGRQPEHDGRHPDLRRRARPARLRRPGPRRVRRDGARHPQPRRSSTSGSRSASSSTSRPRPRSSRSPSSSPATCPSSSRSP